MNYVRQMKLLSLLIRFSDSFAQQKSNSELQRYVTATVEYMASDKCQGLTFDNETHKLLQKVNMSIATREIKLDSKSNTLWHEITLMNQGSNDTAKAYSIMHMFGN